MDLSYKVKQVGENVTFVYMKFKKDWEQWFLLSSDRHWDNPHSNRKLQISHLEEAKEKGAGIIDNGDLFCVMQGKYDPRSDKRDVRPEHMEGNYLDRVVDTAVDFFSPYSHNFIQIGEGNHESAVEKRRETNLTDRLVSGLNDKTGSKVQNGKYSGWVKFLFEHDAGGHGKSINLFRHHGYGGGGPVTKGVISTNRIATYMPDADIVVQGHIHEDWALTSQRVRLSDKGVVSLSEQLFICLPTYKEEYGTGSRGFHIEKGRPPKPIGARWLRFYYKNGEIKFETIRAK